MHRGRLLWACWFGRSVAVAAVLACILLAVVLPCQYCLAWCLHASLYDSTTKTRRYFHISPKMFSTCCVAERQGTNCHMHCCCIITVCAIRFDLLSIFAVSHACISHSSVACVIWKVDIPGLSFLSRSGRGRAGPPRRVIQSDQDPHLASCSKRAACSCCLHVCGGLAMQL